MLATINKKYFEKEFCFDLETYKNLFCGCFISTDGKQAHLFEISDRKDNRKELFHFLDTLKECGGKLVGFNNLGFDYPVIHFMMKKRKCSVLDIYEEAQSIIESYKESRFGKTIQTRFHHIDQKDLYKINHFDNKAKATSLKMLEFNMKMDNLQELPYHHSTVLTEEQMDEVIEYNINDTLATLKFYYECYEAMELREKLSLTYGIDFTNANDTKIGSEIFIQEIEKAQPGSCYYMKNGRREMRQTNRNSIYVKDIILPYIKFERPEFQAILNWFKAQRITETKGVFSDILESDLGEVAKYAEMITKKSKKMDKEPTEAELAKFRRDIPFAQVEVKELKGNKKSYYFTWKIAKSLNVVINGHQYVFGVGGIHSSIESQSISSDDEFIICDWDVSSYYPNLAIKNNIYPEHLGVQFCKTYEDLYQKRKTFPKNSPENKSIKLALNGTYGKSNDKFSPFYDPQYTMAITINGQLSLCMLIEKILKLQDASSVQSNTDGITMKIHRGDSLTADAIVKQWEKDTKLEMERNDYSKMHIRDVNNYIAVYAKDGKAKLKGAYEYQLEHHKDNSCIVIQKAVEAFLTEGTAISDYITKHDDKYDFMLRTKVPRSSSLVLVDDNGNETEQQNISRFYVSKAKEAGSLVKVMPPLEGKTEDRRIGICVGRKVKVCNHIVDFAWDIDYTYYIEEANKLVEFFIEVKDED